MDNQDKMFTKISGYLEKKRKKKMMTSFKKYWFVLEGGLLLYYRSKDDYESISPCKGTINLGPPCIVKPCPSLIGVFQIQTRTATVTLRAENLEDQNRWMQAIMGEAQPSRNSNRMSHYRYSLENMSQWKEQIRNSTPESDSSHNSHEDIIHRLQKIGGQSYGTSKIAITKITKREEPSSPSTNSKIIEEQRKSNRYSESLDTEVEFRINNKEFKSAEHIYERISPQSLEENDTDNNTYVENVSRGNTFPLGALNSSIGSEENRPKTFIIENDTYAISIQKIDKPDLNNEAQTETAACITKPKSGLPKYVSKSLDEGGTKSKRNNFLRHSKSFFSTKKRAKDETFIMENDTYVSVAKEDLDKTSGDLNGNNNIFNSEALTEKENAFYLPSRNDNSNNEVLYEVIDKDNVEYAEPCLYATAETDKQSKIKKKLDVKSTETDKHKNKIKKRSSFIKRVWKKKNKNKNKNEAKVEDEKLTQEDLYETVPTKVVEKMGVTDSKAIEMLSELQNILEHKVPILLERITSDKTSPLLDTAPDTLKETNLPTNSRSITDPSLPLLPPKASKQDAYSPCHDVPIANKPVELPPKKKKHTNVKSLDEILDELDSQEPQSRDNKVKKLIKKFSSSELFESDVVLRDARKSSQRKYINPNELNILLEELAKVSNAPMLLPGVTSSLNGANIKDEELSKLLPVKQRRFSEPDYDIPRPHKSLTIVPKKDYLPDNVIGSTRFFGHILKPSGIIVPNEINTSESTSQLNSIAPDSLETTKELIQSPIQNKTPEESEDNEDHHKYYKFLDRKLFKHPLSPINSKDINIIYNANDVNINNTYAPIIDNIHDYVIDNEIYAEPRLITNEITIGNIVDSDQDDEVFVDSLEVCKHEVSTEF